MVEMSGGRLERATVYVTIGRMMEKGYLESQCASSPHGKPLSEFTSPTSLTWGGIASC